MGLHHVVLQLFQLHSIAALAVDTVSTPFPFPTACQLHMTWKTSGWGLVISRTSARNVIPDFPSHECTNDSSPMPVELIRRQGVWFQDLPGSILQVAILAQDCSSSRVCCSFLQWSQMVLARVVFYCAGMLPSVHGTGGRVESCQQVGGYVGVRAECRRARGAGTPRDVARG